MKIGIDARMIKATGIGRYTENLIKELAKIDQENQYIIFLKKDEFSYFKLPGKNFKKVLADFHWYSLKEQLKLPKIIAKEKVDLIHFSHFNVPFFYKGKFVSTIHDLTLHYFKNIKRGSIIHFLIYQLKHLFYKRIIRRAVKKSLKIFVPSKFTMKDLIKTLRVPQEKIVVTYEGGPSEDLLKKVPDNKVLEKFNIKSPFILYVGNAYPHKNLEGLVKSLKYLNQDVKLVLVGKIDKFYQKIKEEVLNFGFEKRVFFTDFVTDEELVALYKNARAFVFPSFNEGFGLPALEAMAFGLPVLSSSRSSLPEVLEESALYFDPNNPKDIALKISQIIKNKRLRDELKEKGYNQVKKYSWKEMAQETLNIYKEVLKNG